MKHTAQIPRIVPLALLVGCMALVLLAATSMVSGSESPGGPQVPAAGAETTTTQPDDCLGALPHFSGDHDDARYVIWRESRNDPTAQNERSTAAGCYQLLVKHSWRFDEVGCSWAQRYEPVCNTKAADHLYREAGWEPWS